MLEGVYYAAVSGGSPSPEGGFHSTLVRALTTVRSTEEDLTGYLGVGDRG